MLQAALTAEFAAVALGAGPHATMSRLVDNIVGLGFNSGRVVATGYLAVALVMGATLVLDSAMADNRVLLPYCHRRR